jgi:CPA2 family monovalent cation:H+ antiporter-2
LGADIVIMGEREIARGMIEELERRDPDVAEKYTQRAAGGSNI